MFHTRIVLRSLAALCAAAGFIQAVSLSVLTPRASAQTPASTPAECVTWPRVLPPEGLAIAPERQAAWEKRLAALQQQLDTKKAASPYWADCAALVKACQLAIAYREFYSEKDFAKCDRVLQLAEERAAWLDLNAQSPTRLPGEEGKRMLQVRGFQSRIDGSAQPIGLIIPEDLKPQSDGVPLYVWLHGRGDKATDLHFICERLDKKGEVAPADAITLHPFGRHCVGYKSAGSIDVMEAIDFALANYPINPRKIVLIGFSMGGAGVWHLAAHYNDRFVAASPGAGFAETARYQNLTPDKYPPQYEQTLWSVYDVPGYTRNLFNTPLIAYSGELDKQIQAARVMEEAFQAEGRQLEHLIGPGMGHKYHPEVLKDLLARLKKIADQGRPASPDTLLLQTRHLQFAKRRWIRIDGMQQPYADTRVDAHKINGGWELKTKNVSRLDLSPPAGAQLVVDGSPVTVPADAQSIKLVKLSKTWQPVDKFPIIRKHPGISGPIDDAFFGPFLIVTPTGRSPHAAVNRWIDCELPYTIDRWRSLMRGEPRVKRDVDVTAEDMQKYHLILWGDPTSNQLIAKALAKPTVPLVWNEQQIQLGSNRWDAKQHMPAVIMPNPAAPNRYIVLNSGLTFRTGHDRTNSLQNPHLPDWAIVSLESPPSATSPGLIAAAGFFNDSWQLDQ